MTGTGDKTTPGMSLHVSVHRLLCHVLTDKAVCEIKGTFFCIHLLFHSFIRLETQNTRKNPHYNSDHPQDKQKEKKRKLLPLSPPPPVRYTLPTPSLSVCCVREREVPCKE